MGFTCSSQNPSPNPPPDPSTRSPAPCVMYKGYLHPLHLLSQSRIQDQVQVSKFPRMECRTSLVRLPLPNPTWRLRHEPGYDKDPKLSKPNQWLGKMWKELLSEGQK